MKTLEFKPYFFEPLRSLLLSFNKDKEVLKCLNML